VKLNLSGAPGGVEEVLVVLAGVHQAIPPGPVEDDSATKMLPPPPMEKGNDSGQQPGTVQTEADKVVQKYQQLGKDQGHVFGALASGIPNFNAKAPAPTAQTAKPPEAASKPAVSAPSPNSVVAPAPFKPTLPLGSPRRKAPATDTQPPPQQ
jgi:rod shape-determining protein MreC